MVKTVSEKDLDRETDDLLQRRSIFRPDGITDQAGETQERLKRLVRRSDNGVTDRIQTTKESCTTSVYHHESGNLFAEDVDQHMTILPEIITATAGITIDDIQVGELEVQKSYDQEKLRQLIWHNRHLQIAKS